MPRGRKQSPGGQGRQKTKYSRANDIYGKKLDVINHLFQTNDMQRTLGKFYGHLSPDKRETKRKLIYAWAKQRTHIEDMRCVTTGASQKSTREIGTATVISREGIPISAPMLQLKAQSVADDEGVLSDVFTGAWSWRNLFLKRHGLSFRTRTR
uniref:Uncharacterized protein AlNc14C285G10162 n=1 Tax=Albugo laibachii Nc14 TaxID=890382 RepID=F0WV17_9STRA|nr:conserved hypothetical protein [Albugo laibachii Nc14]|eukprot:CCA25253.1 conserved hypothetical protein [Albugo laibachii Nc14]